VLAQAAGIQGHLAAAGCNDGAIAWWWRRPRRELGDMTPADCVALFGARAGQRLLDLARADAQRLEGEVAAGLGPPVQSNP
jgi:hypothetical protein